MQHTILAVDPGLRAMGVAVLSNEGALRHAGVLTSPRDPSTAQRIRTIADQFAELVALYRPRRIALEAAYASRNRSLALVHQVVRACLRRARRIPVAEIPSGTIRRRLLGFGRGSKRDVAQAVVSRYPQLRVYAAGSQRTWRERHFEHLIDAVAVGLASLEAPPNSPSSSSRIRVLPCRRRAGATRSAQDSRRSTGEFTT